QRTREVHLQLERREPPAGGHRRVDRAAKRGVEQRRRESAVRDAGPVVKALFGGGGEDDAALLDFRETDAEQIDHRRRRHLARQHLAEELQAAHHAARFDVGHDFCSKAACSSRSTRYRILPTALIGSVSRTSTDRGTLYSVRLVRQKSMISSGVPVAPGLNATHAFTTSP